MSQEERVVAVISPWGNLAALVKQGFRVQSLPREKMVLVWREDLTGEKDLRQAISTTGIEIVEVRRRSVTEEWDE